MEKMKIIFLEILAFFLSGLIMDGLSSYLCPLTCDCFSVEGLIVCRGESLNPFQYNMPVNELYRFLDWRFCGIVNFNNTLLKTTYLKLEHININNQYTDVNCSTIPSHEEKYIITADMCLLTDVTSYPPSISPTPMTTIRPTEIHSSTESEIISTNEPLSTSNFPNTYPTTEIETITEFPSTSTSDSIYTNFADTYPTTQTETISRTKSSSFTDSDIDLTTEIMITTTEKTWTMDNICIIVIIVIVIIFIVILFCILFIINSLYN